MYLILIKAHQANNISTTSMLYYNVMKLTDMLLLLRFTIMTITSVDIASKDYQLLHDLFVFV